MTESGAGDRPEGTASVRADAGRGGVDRTEIDRDGRREGQTFAGDSLLARYASFVKLPHTLFALPFAGVGALFASYAYADAVDVATIGWIVVAFTAARFAAMGFNRIADRRHDALNPRTRDREIPAGRLSLAQAGTAVLASAVLFVFAAFRLNPLCGWLSPVALAWVLLYSYTKRFTVWSHHVLGFALGMAPVGAYLAVTGEWATPWYALPAVAAAVMFWVAGFDVIYSIQDLDFDRAHGLHSLPASHGVRRALSRARLYHLASILLFSLPWLLDWFAVGWLYLAGVAAASLLLLYEHAIVRDAGPGRIDLDRIDRAFFRANVGVSTMLFVFTLLDRLLLA